MLWQIKVDFRGKDYWGLQRLIPILTPNISIISQRIIAVKHSLPPQLRTKLRRKRIAVSYYSRLTWKSVRDLREYFSSGKEKSAVILSYYEHF